MLRALCSATALASRPQASASAAAARSSSLSLSSSLFASPSSSLFLARRSLHYKARMSDMRFVLNEVLDAPGRYARAGHDDADPETVEAMLTAGAQFAEEVLAPLNEVGDREGCVRDPTTADVRTATGFKEAYAEYAQQGWQGLSVPTAYGGQGLPMSIGLVNAEMVGTANWSWGMYPGLAIGAMNTLLNHGSEEMKQKYLTQLASGKWLGSMCLTEPQCGSDLAQVRTSAVPQGDGSYHLDGTKIFISAGEHDFTENIVHIVLARLPDAPPGTKGISLFLVPKYLVRDDGSLDTTKKNVVCGGIESKLGIHGSSTCTMNFDASVGWLIGEPNTGLRQMFTFMNTARIGTAVQGLAIAEQALQNSVPQAQERLAMRSLSGAKFPDKPADPIIVHPNVRQNLMFMKAVSEGARAMVYDGALISDGMISPDPKVREATDRELGLFTPVLKGVLTELGVECAQLGIQVWGGAGFIAGNGMEQIYRDAKISTIYEGTTGIQALDLIGRKVMLNKGKQMFGYTGKTMAYCKDVALACAPLRAHAWQLCRRTFKLASLTARLMGMASRSKDVVGSASVDYLFYFGYVVMAYYWLRMAHAAHKALALPDAERRESREFYEAKLATADFFFERVLPRCDTLAATMTSKPKLLFAVDSDKFVME